ncbi:abortive phage infection protein [Streptomyces sp. WAC 01529]|uniref:abortive phage infection protein n=1 Tax=Streptomyces sp. WAC 01529 TaxID=2203205 RepID=UPI000F6B7D5C|nr:abortive phage infection protein [Streptomyces sp. WAC 01529]AZM54436.1 abortive phage infection protein [Streptomyces sp. WAC 01529]
MRNEAISRARFIAGAGAGAVAVAVAGGSASAATPTGVAAATGSAEAARTAREAPAGARGLAHRGVCYEVVDGESHATRWAPARMRADLRAIRQDLHATTVSVFGDGVERLAATASEAAERGLHVWLQPRLGDVPESDILDHLAETGRHAERMRRQGARVCLSVGCEFLLYVPGIVPGANAVERVENILKGNYDPQAMVRKLRAFIARAAKTGRSVFRGPLTYGAAHEDDVDWSLFDLVSVNYYAYHPTRDAYIKELTPYRRWGKPVAITECGTCTYEGAPERGGMGWHDVVDYDKRPPEIIGDLKRSEGTQAAYLLDVFGAFEAMGLHAALVYNFVTPDAPHHPERRHDLDMAGYSLTKTVRDRPDDPESPWHWEPKESFRALARHFARAAHGSRARR